VFISDLSCVRQCGGRGRKRWQPRMALSAELVSERAWRDRRGAGILL